MTDGRRYTCTMAPDELPDRLEQLRALKKGLLGRERDGQQVRLRFDRCVAPVVETFVHDESACCSFYEFDLEHTDRAVVLTVWAPAEADELLQSLYEAFDADHPPAS